MFDHLFILLPAAVISAPLWLALFLKRPRTVVIVYLLISTKMFGFVPLALSRHVDSALFVFHCAMIASTALWIIKRRSFPSRGIAVFLAGVFGLTAFGILYPWFLGFSGIQSTVVDGKAMFSYAVLGYLAIHAKRFGFSYILKVFCFIGLTLSAILIFGKLTGFSPPGYHLLYENNLRQSIHVSHITYIMLALMLYLSQLLHSRISAKDVIVVAVLFLGLLLQGHRAVFLSTLAGTTVLFLFRARKKIKHAAVLVMIPVFILTGLLGSGRFFQQTFSDPISELFDTSDGAVAARNRTNVIRYLFIRERPFWGFGFIDETSSLGEYIETVSDSRFNQSLGVVDSGYIDMLVRFGIIGTVSFCLLWCIMLLMQVKKPDLLDNGQLTAAIFLACYIPINYTFSVFTYDFGIIAACFALYILYILSGVHGEPTTQVESSRTITLPKSN